MKISNKYIILFLVIIFTGKAAAQLSLNISTVNFYDDNIFQYNNKVGSFISSNILGASYAIANEKSQLKLSYNGNYNIFRDLPQRNFSENTIILDYTRTSDDETSNFNIGGGYLFKTNKDEYNLYDENNIGLFGSYKFLLLDENIGSVGYNFNLISYPNLSAYSYSEHIFTFNSHFSFNTKTVYIAEATLGLKNYIEDYYYPVSDSSAGSGSTMGYQHGQGMNMMGKQKGKSSGLLNNLNSQILISNRIAQSIIDEIGVQFTYSLRYNLVNNSRVIQSSTYNLSDEELFDDHYGYSGHEFELGYTHILPLGFILKGSFNYLIKNYNSQFLSTLVESSDLIDRNDKKSIYLISIRKKLELFGEIFDPFDIFVNFIHQNNSSSISYYNFNSNSIYFGISSNLNF
jgi:hypothetical protein